MKSNYTIYDNSLPINVSDKNTKWYFLLVSFSYQFKSHKILMFLNIGSNIHFMRSPTILWELIFQSQNIYHTKQNLVEYCVHRRSINNSYLRSISLVKIRLRRATFFWWCICYRKYKRKELIFKIKYRVTFFYQIFI